MSLLSKDTFGKHNSVNKFFEERAEQRMQFAHFCGMIGIVIGGLVMFIH